ncbi:related to retrotransposon HobS hobase [Ustilago sp. UG-2017b]|nr:related to retrotransposon HobS hobase [Ustilago sp. UG-2017b]
MELESTLTDVDEPDMPLEDQIMAVGEDIKSDLNMYNAAIRLVTTVGQDPLTINNDPQTLSQAQASDEQHDWEKTIEVELNSLNDTGTWTITDLPKGRKAIMAKWVFKTKHNADGNVVKYKARLVAWGFTQMHGVDYHDTYSPVVSMTCLSLVICYGLKFHFRIRQIDFVAAYLNGELTDIEIYMVLPLGFEDRYRQLLRSVCHLKKVLYGLKQSGCEWFAKLDDSLLSMGFKQLGRDMVVYRMEMVIIAIYVDNIIIVRQECEVVS